MITNEEWEKNGVTVTKPCLRVTQIQPTKKLDGQAQARQQQPTPDRRFYRGRYSFLR